jgi:hypothetical protein
MAVWQCRQDNVGVFGVENIKHLATPQLAYDALLLVTFKCSYPTPFLITPIPNLPLCPNLNTPHIPHPTYHISPPPLRPPYPHPVNHPALSSSACPSILASHRTSLTILPLGILTSQPQPHLPRAMRLPHTTQPSLLVTPFQPQPPPYLLNQPISSFLLHPLPLLPQQDLHRPLH